MGLESGRKVSMTTKYAILLPNGAADEPLEELADRTPLEAADIPHLDSIVATGRLGTVRTIPAGLVPGGDVAAMTLLGYDAARYYTGRAPIEAVARNVKLSAEDVVFRCNLVTVVNGELVDYSAGHIRSHEARRIIDDLNAEFDGEGVRFHSGLSYRNLVVISDPSVLDVACIPPHEIQGEPVSDYPPKGRGAGRIADILRRAGEVVSNHDINLVRSDLGETPANAIWVWGQGVTPIMRRFRQRFGVAAAAVGAVDLIRGLAKLLGLTWIDVPDVTGDLNSDLAAKGRAAANALDEYDLVVVHVEAPAEAAHMGHVEGKVQALQRFDSEVVGPVLDRLRSFDRWKVLVATGQKTLCAQRASTAEPTPFCMAGPSVAGGIQQRCFNERLAAESDLHIDPGHDLMEYFLRR